MAKASHNKSAQDEAPITAEDYAQVKPLLDKIVKLQRQRFGDAECPPEDFAAIVVEVCRNYADKRLEELKSRIASRG